MIISEQEKNRIRKLHEAHKSFHGTSLIKEQDKSWYEKGKEYVKEKGSEVIDDITSSEYYQKAADAAGDIWDNVKAIGGKYLKQVWESSNEMTQKKASRKAKELWDSMKGAGTDEDSFWNVTKRYAKDDESRAMIRAAFSRAYGKSLKEFIKGDFGCSKLTASWSRVYTLGKYDCGKIRKKALKAWGYSA